MRHRLRSLPLGAWLAIGFALAVAVPALSAATAWWAVGARQQADADNRLREARALIARTGERLQQAGPRRALFRGLGELRVEADLQLADTKAVSKRGVGAPPAKATEPQAATDGTSKVARAFVTQTLAAAMPGRHGKSELVGRYETHGVTSGSVTGTLFVERPSGAVRLAATCAVGLSALALALIAGVALLRRWVVAPLARLAADAQRIAGGELDVAPISSRTREVAEVGAALRGMADGLRSALAEQRNAEQRRRFLVSAIAHDLRTPLFTLRGSLEAIEHGIGDRDHLRRAQDKARLLDRLVGDLFTFSRLEYTGPELAPETVDAVALAHEAADIVDSRVAVVAPAAPITLECDHAAVVRVLVNLLDNAVRHARLQVELRVCAVGEEVLFAVLDDGPGIPPEDLPQLSEPLFRADRTRNSATGGAGLGLAIVQRLTAAHGGVVKAENRAGGGARFVLRFPRGPGGRPPRALRRSTATSR